MNIDVKLDKDFEKEFARLCDKYGEDFKKINGFAKDNFNLSGFIDNFIDSQRYPHAILPQEIH